jgi:hypothetical protein
MDFVDINSKATGQILHRYMSSHSHKTKNERVNISEDAWNIQISSLKFSTGRMVNPHSHLSINRGIGVSPTNEIWLVTSGDFRITFFDTDCKTVLEELTAEIGFISLSLYGLHSIQAISEGSTFLEIKNGPYVGKDITYEI